MAENRGVRLEGDELINLSTDTELDLDEDQDYTLQNRSHYLLNVLLHAETGVPSITSDATKIRTILVKPLDSILVRYSSGESLYAWFSGNTASGIIAMVEAD